MINNKKIGLGAFFANLAPAWFSALAPFFLLFSLYALITSIIALYSEKANKNETINVTFKVLTGLGTIATIWVIYELVML